MTINSINKSTKIVLWFALGAFIWFIYHILTLTISPPPWFDDVWFASITHSFVNNGKFLLEICPLQTDQEVLAYGPMYFWLTSLSVKLFGFQIISIRLVNFIFGVMNIFIFYKILTPVVKNRVWALFAIALVMLDQAFSSNTHNGRMDSVALFFYMVTLFILLYRNETWYKYVGCGLLAACALLTSPRSGFLFLSVPVTVLFIKQFRFFNWFYSMCIFGTVVVAIYSIWILSKFGSYQNFISYYTELSYVEGGTLVTNFLGGNLNIPKQQYPLIISVVVLGGIYAFRRLKWDAILCTFLVNIIAFYFIITDTGVYSVYIIFFYYGLLAVFVDRLELSCRLKVGLVSFLLLLNLGIFIFKASTVAFVSSGRSWKKMDQIVQTYIPANSKVVGNDRYYYSVVKNASQFQTIERPGSPEKRFEYHKEIFNYDYLIVSMDDPFMEKQYLRDHHILLGTFTLQNKNKILDIMKKIYPMGEGVYDGKIYKRIRKSEYE